MASSSSVSRLTGGVGGGRVVMSLTNIAWAIASTSNGFASPGCILCSFASCFPSESRSCHLARTLLRASESHPHSA
eukprot:125330-Amorphochlora_amoeboformis.AAC.1